VIVAASKSESCRSIAARSGVSGFIGCEVSQRYRATSAIAPSKMSGHRKSIVKRFSQTPRSTPDSLNDELAARRAACGLQLTANKPQRCTNLPSFAKFDRK
jgi:hypothetical protein